MHLDVLGCIGRFDQRKMAKKAGGMWAHTREENPGSYKKKDGYLAKHDMEVDRLGNKMARDMCGTSRVHRVESRRKEIDSTRGGEENEKKIVFSNPTLFLLWF